MATLFFCHQVIPVMSRVRQVVLPTVALPAVDFATCLIFSFNTTDEISRLAGVVSSLAVCSFLVPKSSRGEFLFAYTGYKMGELSSSLYPYDKLLKDLRWLQKKIFRN